jgi:putative flippase GtrA
MILYLIFGGLTTLVNIVVFWFCERVVGFSTAPANAIAWVLAVLFAFVTNKLFVFESKSMKAKIVLKELGSFVLARVISGGIDMGIVLVGVDVMHIDSLIVKIFSNIVVVILNYIASKFIIFKKKPDTEIAAEK